MNSVWQQNLEDVNRQQGWDKLLPAYYSVVTFEPFQILTQKFLHLMCE